MLVPVCQVADLQPSSSHRRPRRCEHRRDHHHRAGFRRDARRNNPGAGAARRDQQRREPVHQRHRQLARAQQQRGHRAAPERQRCPSACDPREQSAGATSAVSKPIAAQDKRTAEIGRPISLERSLPAAARTLRRALELRQALVDQIDSRRARVRSSAPLVGTLVSRQFDRLARPPPFPTVGCAWRWARRRGGSGRASRNPFAVDVGRIARAAFARPRSWSRRTPASRSRPGTQAGDAVADGDLVGRLLLAFRCTICSMVSPCSTAAARAR